MKKALAFSCLAALLLAGCGAEENYFAGKPDDGRPVEEDTSETESAETTVSETTESSAETTASETAETSEESSAPESYVDIYKQEIERVCDELAEDNDGCFNVQYSAYDIDKNGVPELLMKYKTTPADLTVFAYTVSADGKLENLGEVGGTFDKYACDTNTGELVMTSIHMGHGTFVRFALKDGVLSETGRESADYSSNDEYRSAMSSMNIAEIALVDACNFGRNTETISSVTNADGSHTEEKGLYLDIFK